MLEATFIDAGDRRLFCTIRRPGAMVRDGQSAPAVLVVPAFGDEMSKSRKMLTETAKQLNDAGIAVLFPDLSGTGDSSGGFADSSWADWVQDLTRVDSWAAAQGLQTFAAIGVRTGALLAAAVAAARDGAPWTGTVFWQPVTAGKSFVRQLLRARTVAKAVGAGERERGEDIQASILAGAIEYVAGYPLAVGLVGPLLEAQIGALASEALGEVHAFQVTRLEESLGSARETTDGFTQTVHKVSGEPYWNSTEIVCNDTIVDATARIIRELRDGGN